MMNFFSTEFSGSFDEAINKTTEELSKEGFGIVSDINFTETMKNKLGIEFRNYRILGACNPPFAHQSIEINDKIGLFLPCNIVVQEHQPNQIEITTIDPLALVQMSEDPNMEKIANEVRIKLQSVIEAIQA